MRLAKLYFKMSLRRSLQYRLNFILLCISVAPIHLIQMLFSWFIAKKFNGFDTWDGWNLIFLYGVLLTSYSIAQVFFRTLRYVENFVISGSLDVYFIKPYSILYGIIFNNLSVMEIFSQLLPSVIILMISCVYNQISWNVSKVLVLFGAIVGGAFIQMALFLLIGSVSFWTMRSSHLERIFFAFKDFLNYPLYVYGKKVVAFLTYIFPLAFINYYPSLYILERGNSMSVLNFMTIPVAVILSCIAILVWKISIEHYNSAGS